jgi:outer membrane protein TolC
MLKKLAFLVSFLPAALAAGETLTVEQAVTTALQNNANIRNARLEVEKGETRVAASRTRRLPSLTFDAVGSEALNRLSFEFKEGAFGTFPSTGPIPNRDTKIEVARTFNTFAMARLSQPLTQLHKINLGVRLNETSLAVDKEKERAARQAIAREVKSAYVNVVAAESFAAAAREAVAVYTEVEREMNVRASQKVALEADRLDAAAKLAATRATALSADNTLASVKDQLFYLVGREFDVVADTPQQTGVSGAHVDSRPDVREAELRVEQARLDAKLKSAERIPDIALTVAHATPIHFDALPQNINTAGIVMSYEPFTWGRRSAEIAEKRHTIEQAENALRDRRAVAAVEINVARRKLDEAAAQITVRHLELETMRERLRVTKARFNEQAARPDEMYEASAALTQAAARKQEAIAAWWTARADYQQAIGEE